MLRNHSNQQSFVAVVEPACLAAHTRAGAADYYSTNICSGIFTIFRNNCNNWRANSTAYLTVQCVLSPARLCFAQWTGREELIPAHLAKMTTHVSMLQKSRGARTQHCGALMLSAGVGTLMKIIMQVQALAPPPPPPLLRPLLPQHRQPTLALVQRSFRCKQPPRYTARWHQTQSV